MFVFVFYSVDELFVGKKEQGTRRSRKTEQFSFFVAWERNDQKSKASSKLIGQNRFSIVPVPHSFITLCSKWEDMEVTNEVLYYTEHVHAQVRDCSTTSKVDGAYTSTRSNTHRVRDRTQWPISMNENTSKENGYNWKLLEWWEGPWTTSRKCSILRKSSYQARRIVSRFVENADWHVQHGLISMKTQNSCNFTFFHNFPFFFQKLDRFVDFFFFDFAIGSM